MSRRISIEEFSKRADVILNDVKEMTRERREAFDIIKDGIENGKPDFQGRYLSFLIDLIKIMDQTIEISATSSFESINTLVSMLTGGSNRDENIELLNAMMANVLDKTEEYDKVVKQIKSYFKDLETMR